MQSGIEKHPWGSTSSFVAPFPSAWLSSIVFMPASSPMQPLILCLNSSQQNLFPASKGPDVNARRSHSWLLPMKFSELSWFSDPEFHVLAYTPEACLALGREWGSQALSPDLLFLSKVQEVPFDLLVDFSAFTDLYFVISPHLGPVLVRRAHPWAPGSPESGCSGSGLETGHIVTGVAMQMLKVQTLKPDSVGLHPRFTTY